MGRTRNLLVAIAVGLGALQLIAMIWVVHRVHSGKQEDNDLATVFWGSARGRRASGASSSQRTDGLTGWQADARVLIDAKLRQHLARPQHHIRHHFESDPGVTLCSKDGAEECLISTHEQSIHECIFHDVPMPAVLQRDGSMACKAPPFSVTINQGDTLSGIANKFSLSYPVLLARNKHIKDAHNIAAGEHIQILVSNDFHVTLGTEKKRIIFVNLSLSGSVRYEQNPPTPSEGGFVLLGAFVEPLEAATRARLTCHFGSKKVRAEGIITEPSHVHDKSEDDDTNLGNTISEVRQNAWVRCNAPALSGPDLDEREEGVSRRVVAVVPTLVTLEDGSGNQQAVSVTPDGGVMTVYARRQMCISPGQIVQTPDICIVTVPKPFGDISKQVHAVNSWRSAMPSAKIVLLSTAQDANSLASQQWPSNTHIVQPVSTNSKGTPLLSSIWRLMGEHCGGKPDNPKGSGESGGNKPQKMLQLFINADIHLSASFLGAAGLLHQRYQVEKDAAFLAVGRRVNVGEENVSDAGEHKSSGCDATLRSDGRVYNRWGVDYFLMTPGALPVVPDFALGRAAYDNWIVAQAGNLGVEVVDLSNVAIASHCQHDYAHIQGIDKENAKLSTADLIKTSESERNIKLTKGTHVFGSVDHANVVVTGCT